MRRWVTVLVLGLMLLSGVTAARQVAAATHAPWRRWQAQPVGHFSRDAGRWFDAAGELLRPLDSPRREDQESNRQALALLRRGLMFGYNVRSRVQRLNTSFAVRLPQFAQLLAREARGEADQGRWAAAVDTQLDGLRLGLDYARWAPAFQTRAGLGVQAQMRRGLAPRLERLSAAELRAADYRLRLMAPHQTDFADTVAAERLRWQRLATQILAEAGWRRIVFDPDLLLTDASTTRRTQIYLAGSRQELFDALDHRFECLAAWAQQPLGTPPPPDPAPGSGLYGPPAAGLAELRLAMARNQAANVLLRCAVAAEGWRREHGAYPDSLAALAPDWLSAVPIDPLTGGAPAYRGGRLAAGASDSPGGELVWGVDDG